jgi:calcineurin-like phosphoesterase family protein
MNKWIISDLHLGHKAICSFEPNRLGELIEDPAEHDSILESRWFSTIRPKDIVYVLGDVAFNVEALERFESWPGTKILVKGNHDDKAEEIYRRIFTKTWGVLKYHKVWFSHAPIHPDELRGCPNIHGHVHSNIIRTPYGEPDKSYRSVCVEANQGWPESLDSVIEEVRNG